MCKLLKVSIFKSSLYKSVMLTNNFIGTKILNEDLMLRQVNLMRTKTF